MLPRPRPDQEEMLASSPVYGWKAGSNTVEGEGSTQSTEYGAVVVGTVTVYLPCTCLPHGCAQAEWKLKSESTRTHNCIVSRQSYSPKLTRAPFAIIVRSQFTTYPQIEYTSCTNIKTVYDFFSYAPLYVGANKSRLKNLNFVFVDSNSKLLT